MNDNSVDGHQAKEHVVSTTMVAAKGPSVYWRVILALFLVILFPSTLPAQAATGATTFHNEIKSNCPDPWMFYRDGYYYLTCTRGDRITISKATTVVDLGNVPEIELWRGANDATTRCCNIWAPELHYLRRPDGQYRWYLYYTAGDNVGDDTDQHTYVLESRASDPLGPYDFKARIYDANADQLAIDGTVLQKSDGSLYFLWSGWVSCCFGAQQIYIASMSNPWTLSSGRVAIASSNNLNGLPSYGWEQIPRGVNEGPEILQRNGKIFVIFSASGCETPDYKLGQLTNSDGNVLNPGSWTKAANPVFQRSDANGVYGPGHNGFFQSPDGTENWIVYHAVSTSAGNCGGERSARIQPFTFNSDGTPNFGTPVALSTPLAVPSGDWGVGRYEAERATLNDANARTAVGGASNNQVVGNINNAGSYVEFSNVFVPKAGTYALSIRYANGMGANSSHNVTVNGVAAGTIVYPNTRWDVWTTVTKQFALNAGNNTIRLSKGDLYAEVDYIELPRYEAENATLYNKAAVVTNTSASNSKKVGYIDPPGSYVEFTVQVPNAGAYTLRVPHSTGYGVATHNVSVNGGASFALSYPNDGWDNWTTVTTTVNLNAGSNTIRFTNGTNYSELDYIEIYK